MQGFTAIRHGLDSALRAVAYPRLALKSVWPRLAVDPGVFVNRMLVNKLRGVACASQIVTFANRCAMRIMMRPSEEPREQSYLFSFVFLSDLPNGSVLTRAAHPAPAATRSSDAAPRQVQHLVGGGRLEEQASIPCLPISRPYLRRDSLDRTTRQ